QPVPRQRMEMPNLLRAVDRVCDAHYLDVKTTIEKHGVEWVRGHARFVDPHTLTVDGREIRAEVVVVATGSRPSQPSFVEGGAARPAPTCIPAARSSPSTRRAPVT